MSQSCVQYVLMFSLTPPRVTAPETGAEWTISVARATEFACDECECFVDSDLALAITVEPAR